QRMVTPSHVVYLGGLPGLKKIEFTKEGELEIDALVTIDELSTNRLLAERYPMLPATCRQVANPQVRAMATIGGNLCYADPATDPPTCLIAMGARVRIQGPQGTREIGLEEFYVDYYQTDLRPAEILTQIILPAPDPEFV